MLLRGERNAVVVVVVLIGLTGGFAPNAGATDYFVSESVGDDAWSGLLPEPNGSMTDGPKQSPAVRSTALHREIRSLQDGFTAIERPNARSTSNPIIASYTDPICSTSSACRSPRTSTTT